MREEKDKKKVGGGEGKYWENNIPLSREWVILNIERKILKEKG